MKKTPPKNPTELTDEQFERVKEFFEELRPDGNIRNCPVCGGDKWTRLRAASVLVGLALPNSIRTDKGYPVVGLTCDTCGFLSLHRAQAVLGKAFPDG